MPIEKYYELIHALRQLTTEQIEARERRMQARARGRGRPKKDEPPPNPCEYVWQRVVRYRNLTPEQIAADRRELERMAKGPGRPQKRQLRELFEQFSKEYKGRKNNMMATIARQISKRLSTTYTPHQIREIVRYQPK